MATLQTRSHCAYRANQTSLISNPLMLLMCATNVKFAQDFIIYGKWFQKRPFPHIIPWFESWIELLGPVLITAVASRWTRRAVLHMSALLQLMVHFSYRLCQVCTDDTSQTLLAQYNIHAITNFDTKYLRFLYKTMVEMIILLCSPIIYYHLRYILSSVYLRLTLFSHLSHTI